MKVLLINTYDDIGGAAKASTRILKSISNTNEIDISLLVRKKSQDERNIISLNTFISKLLNFFIPFLDRLPLKLYRNKKNHFWNIGWFNNFLLLRKVKLMNPDIIQLNWISEGFISIDFLKKIKKPIIWRLSDSWPFTGGCHIPFDCKNYINNCGNCPQLNSKCSNDISRITWLSKKRAWAKCNITIVAPSFWMKDCVKSSSLFKDRNTVVIYPGVDTIIFRPRDKTFIKKELNLNVDKRYIVFGAIKGTEDINKGFHLLQNALILLKQKLQDTSNIEILVLGASTPAIIVDMGFRINYIGRISDEITLAQYYSIAEVFILPSLNDNSPNALIESLSCGIPAVAFGACGALDMIDHKSNGYLAKPYIVEDLSDGIEWILNMNSCEYDRISKNARSMVLNKFNIVEKAKEYIELYKHISNSVVSEK
jgi:glycosyltransferase involved in cell wall biosynthesis